MQITIKPIIDPEVRALPGAYGRIMNRINLQAYNLARSAQKMFRDETSEWSTQPAFAISGSAQRGQIDITTDDPRFSWYDDGTRPHVIEARNAKVLAFSPGNKTKGIRSGTMVFAKRVYHPGSKAHNVSRRVGDIIEPMLADYIDTAIIDALQGT